MSYWDQFQQSRLTRRRALGATAGIAAGAAALSMIGCGGGNEGGGGGVVEDASGLLHKPVDTTESARTGGTLLDHAPGDATHFDASISNSTGVSGVISPWAYLRLFNFTQAKVPSQADGEVEGILVDKYEVSGDKLQVTLRLRPGIKWDNRPPTSGRTFDAQDVVFSWEKFAKLNPAGADLAYSRSSSSPIESMTATDNMTVAIKLKFPDGSLFPLLATSGHWYLMPRESEGGFDPKQEIRGNGPWILEDYQRSSSFTWRKNPDYYIKGRPFFDKWEKPIVTENATRLAQFRAGNIWTSIGIVPEDILPTKRDLPDTLLAMPDRLSSGTNYVSFGYEGDSPFKDVRVRQAFSMLLDPETFADAIENAAEYRAAGLRQIIARPTVLYPGHGDYWLDPNDEAKFGPTHKYLKYNPKESKDLLTAAGYPNGFDFDFTYVGDGRYGNVYPRVAQVIAGMLSEGGLRPRQNPMQYQLYYDNLFLGYVAPDGKGFNGMILRTGRGFPTAALQYQGQVHKDGSVHHGSTPTGLNAGQGDPKVNALIEKMRQEFDTAAQQSISHEIIRYYTQQAYTIARPTISVPYTLVWPTIANYGVWDRWSNTSNVEQAAHWWIDTTKPPVTKT